MMWSEVLGQPHEGWGIASGRTRGPAAVAVGTLGAALGRAAEASRALGEAIHDSLLPPMRDLADSLESLTPRGGRLSARPPHEQSIPSSRAWAGRRGDLVMHDEVAHWHAPRGRGWGKASGTGGGRPPGYPSEKVPAGSRVSGPPPAGRPRVAPTPLPLPNQIRSIIPIRDTATRARLV